MMSRVRGHNGLTGWETIDRQKRQITTGMTIDVLNDLDTGLVTGGAPISDCVGLGISEHTASRTFLLVEFLPLCKKSQRKIAKKQQQKFNPPQRCD